MLRSCSHAVGRRVTVAMQTRTILCARSLVGRPVAAAGASSTRRFPALSNQFDVAPRRCLSTLTDEELRRKMDDFNDLFVTAREEMEYAEESKETTYFDEEAAAAKEAVEEAVALFEEVLRSVDEKKRTDIMRSSGLRVEQLKAELDQLLLSDDH
ncbi:unnamed protein product [Scytosiphon promiscuus]